MLRPLVHSIVNSLHGKILTAQRVGHFVGLLIPLFWTSDVIPLAFKARVASLICHCLRHMCYLFPGISSGVTSAHLFVANMAAEPFSTRYLQADISGTWKRDPSCHCSQCEMRQMTLYRLSYDGSVSQRNTFGIWFIWRMKYFTPLYFPLQSLLDFFLSIMLLLGTLTIRNSHALRNTGLLGSIECRLWNTQILLWGLLTSSSWNLAVLTIER